MNVLVTGASGFIGSKLVGRLAEGGHAVTALVNKNDISVPQIRMVRGDVSDRSLAFDGDFDVVYHLAAVTPLQKDRKVQQRVNFGGTVNLFDKIKDGSRHVVYASGVGVFGDSSNQIIDESAEKNPDTEFAKIRLAAERFLEKKCREASIGFTATYFGEVYGNGGWFTAQLVDRMKSGKFKMPRAGNYFRSFVHVDDAVSALVAIGEKQRRDEDFIVADSQPALFRDFANFVADGIGVKRPGSVPGFLAKAVLGGDAVKLLTTPTRASNKKISELVEMKFPTYREGLAQVLADIGQM